MTSPYLEQPARSLEETLRDLEVAIGHAMANDETETLDKLKWHHWIIATQIRRRHWQAKHLKD